MVCLQLGGEKLVQEGRGGLKVEMFYEMQLYLFSILIHPIYMCFYTKNKHYWADKVQDKKPIF